MFPIPNIFLIFPLFYSQPEEAKMTTVEDISMLRDTLNRTFESIANTITEHSDLSRQVAALSAAVTQYQSEVAGLREEVKRANDNAEWLRVQLQTATEERETARREAANLHIELDLARERLRVDLDLARERIENVSNTLVTEQETSARHWRDLQELRTAFDDQSAALVSARGELDAAKTEIATLHDTVNALYSRNDDLRVELDRAVAYGSEAALEVRNTKTALASAEAALVQETNAHEGTKSLLTVAEDRIRGLNSEVADLEAELDEANERDRKVQATFDTIGQALKALVPPVQA